jgi:hypothetical protein
MVVLYTPPALEKLTRSGLTFGLSFGVSLPNGKAQGSTTDPLTGLVSTGLESDVVGVLLPVTLDIGYRLTPHWYLGGYFGVAYGTGSNCAEGGTDSASCWETQIRVGVDAEYDIVTDRWYQPWVSVGVGWETMNEMETDQEGDESSGSSNGIEFANVGVGVDFRVHDRSRLGPYFMTSLATYDNGYVHEFFTFGARVRYDTNLLHQ